MRALFFLAALSLSAQAPDGCELQALERWNQFAEHANEYARQKNAGIRDLKLRAKLPKEWESIMRCPCW